MLGTKSATEQSPEAGIHICMYLIKNNTVGIHAKEKNIYCNWTKHFYILGIYLEVFQLQLGQTDSVGHSLMRNMPCRPWTSGTRILSSPSWSRPAPPTCPVQRTRPEPSTGKLQNVLNFTMQNLTLVIIYSPRLFSK